MIYLDRNLVVATLSNTNRPWNNVYKLNDKLAELVLHPENLDFTIKKVIPLSTSEMDRYTGNYKSEKRYFGTFPKR